MNSSDSTMRHPGNGDPLRDAAAFRSISAGFERGTPAHLADNTDRVGESAEASYDPWTIPLWKRSLDITLILLTLPCWLIVMILVTLWVKMVSPGPVIFRQQRIGYRGRRFMILKFRSMHVNADGGNHERYFLELMKSDRPMTKLDASGDSRMIPGGRWMRAMALDELPQIFNVLRREMSLVGPRPCTVFEYENYTALQAKRFNAPPGLTGYWQVNGKNRTTFRRMIALDLLYAKKMSFWLDAQIILKTFPTLIVQVLESRRAGRSKPVCEKPGLAA